MTLDGIVLARGAHTRSEDGMCAMEAAAYLAGEPHSDSPSCVCPTISSFMRALNDSLNHEQRQLLKPYIQRVIGTARDGQSERRGWLALDWLLREHLPTWLHLAGITDTSIRLRAYEEVRNTESLTAISAALTEAHYKAYTAWYNSMYATPEAARCSAICAALESAWDAAIYAAPEAAGDAIWASRYAARVAARIAGAYKIKSTVDKLHRSSFLLLENMIVGSQCVGARVA